MTAKAPGLAAMWVRVETRFLPFADAATEGLPLGRLIRLSLFQVSVGMAMVLLTGTLNRVMIVELSVPASVVAAMVALPIVFAPARALIGHRSDVHRSHLGWRRVPYIWMGTLLQFGGFAIMPFALLVLSGTGTAAVPYAGHVGAALAFLLVGAVSTHARRPASRLPAISPRKKADRASWRCSISCFWSGCSRAPSPFAAALDLQPSAADPGRAGCGGRHDGAQPDRALEAGRPQPEADRSLAPAAELRRGVAGIHAGRTRAQASVTVALGTAAFSMQDVPARALWRPVLGLGVSQTTMLTAILASGTILGLAYSARRLSHGGDPYRIAALGALIGLPAFSAVIISAPVQMPDLFRAGTFLIGLGGGLFAVGMLTAAMNFARRSDSGIALGAWGAVQATAAVSASRPAASCATGSKRWPRPACSGPSSRPAAPATAWCTTSRSRSFSPPSSPSDRWSATRRDPNTNIAISPRRISR